MGNTPSPGRNGAGTSPKKRDSGVQRSDLNKFFETPEDKIENRGNELIAKNDSGNLALLASMRGPKKMGREEASPNSQQHLSRYLEPSGNAHMPPGSPLSTTSEDDIDEEMLLKPIMRSDDSSSHLGDTTETTGLRRNDRGAMSAYFENGVRLNSNQSFSVGDTESSWDAQAKGRKPKFHHSEDEEEETSQNEEESSLSYDDATESSALSRTNTLTELLGQGGGAAPAGEIPAEVEKDK